MAYDHSDGKKHYNKPVEGRTPKNYSAEQLYQTYFWQVMDHTSPKSKSVACHWAFHHQTSTPYYPQSNERAEAAGKSMKWIIRGAWNGKYMNKEKLYRALL